MCICDASFVACTSATIVIVFITACTRSASKSYLCIHTTISITACDITKPGPGLAFIGLEKFLKALLHLQIDLLLKSQKSNGIINMKKTQQVLGRTSQKTHVMLLEARISPARFE